jgi:hypothetical protein
MYFLFYKISDEEEKDQPALNLYFSPTVIDIKSVKADVIFDCTGGRLNPDIWSNKDLTGFIPKNMLKYKGSEFIIDKKINKYIWKSDVFPFQNYLVVNNFSNVEYLSMYNQQLKTEINTIINRYGKEIDYKIMIQIIEDYKDNMNKTNEYIIKFLYNFFISHKTSSISLELFNIYIQHAIKIAKVIKLKNNHKAVYIGAGDTIFHSHFSTGAGLNRTIDFSVMCINTLEYFFNK